MNLQKGKLHTTPANQNNQPRLPYSNSRITGQHISQTQHDYSRQGPGYQQPVPGYRHYQSGSGPSVSGPPHDMSKQATLQGQAPIYSSNPSSAGGIVGGAGGGGPNQSQQGMSGQGAPVSSSPHNTGQRQAPPQVVQQQHQQQQQNSRAQMPYQQYQQSVSMRPVHQPRPAWQGNPMNHTQQPQQQFSNQIQPTWFNPNTNHLQYNMQMMRANPSVAQIINYPGQVNSQFPSSATSFQQLPANQQQVVYQQGNPAQAHFVYSQQRPTAAAYFNHVPQAISQMNYPGMYNAQGRTNIQSVPQAPPPQKEKNLITIQDPDTFQDITKNVLFGSSKNNANQSETSHQPSVIAIEFAAKVASVATPVATRPDIELPPVKPGEPDGDEEDGSASATVYAPTEASFLEAHHYEAEEAEEGEFFQPEDNVACYAPYAIDDKQDAMETNVAVAEQPSDAMQTSFVPPPQEEVVVATPVDSEPLRRTSTPTTPTQCASKDSTPIRELEAETTSVVAMETTTVEESGETIQQNGDVSEGFATVQDAEALEASRISKKVSHVRKMKELNIKGQSKGGGEMDAFLDNDNESVVSPSVVVSKSPPSSDPATVAVAVDNEDDAEVDKEEERKVAEKNEENNRFSQEIEKSGDATTPVIDETQPKYQYREDQWSPLNPEGKKHYDRAFLIMLQSEPMSMQKPKGLPDLDVIKDRALQHSLPDHNNRSGGGVPSQMAHRNHHDLFMPQYAQGGGGGGGGGGRGGGGGNTPRHPQGGGGGGVNRRSQQGRDKPKKIISISSSLNEDVKLHAASNAWKAGGRKDTQEETSVETAKTAELSKRVRGILNKLTPQKFTTLVEQVKDLPIDTEARLTGVIDLVFEKAVDEPNFSVPYANMCNHLAKKAVPSDIEGVNVNFRKLLLIKCQREFERDKNDTEREKKHAEMLAADSEEKTKILKEELAELERKSRRRSLGNIRFIGELFKLHMLTSNIMHDCLLKLLNERDEDSLECLCRLLTTIGKELDEKVKPVKGEKQRESQMDGYFDIMKKIVNQSKTTSPRVRFMLQDVIDLRTHQWIPRREENAPKTIAQIHHEAEKEAQLQQQILANTPLPQNQNKRMDDRDRGRKGGRAGYQEEGWLMVNSKNRGSFATPQLCDSKPPKISAKQFDDSIQLGPGGRSFTSWSRGSSGGSTSKTLNQDSDKAATPSNRFSLLQSSDQPESKRMQQRHELNASPAFNKSSSSARREPSSGRAGSQGPAGNSGQLRKSASQMTTRERENAIAATMKVFHSDSPHSGTDTPPLSAGKGSDEHKDEAVVTPTSETAKKPVLTEEEFQSKTVDIVDEFLHNSDFEEAIQCVVDLTTPSTVPEFISVTINHVLERSSQALSMMGQLMQRLVARKIITLSQYVSGLQSILELMDELEIDVPKIYACMSEIVHPMIADNSMAFLKEALQPYVENRVAARFMPVLLHLMAGQSGPNKVYDLWHDAGLTWKHFLRSDQNQDEFISDKKLEFTITKTKPSCSVGGKSVAETKTNLDFLLNRTGGGNEEIFDWIEANIGDEQIRTPPFIRALVTAVIESAIKLTDGQAAVEGAALKTRIMLLQKYLENKEHLELQALYAIQALVNKLQHPKGMIASIFEVLYDEDAISEDAFGTWEKSTDPAEQEGKGVALKSATSFFTWLNEADEDSGPN